VARTAPAGLRAAHLRGSEVIESVNSMAENRCGRVDPWKYANQKHRWLATALLNFEPRLRRLLAYRRLRLLRAAIQKDLAVA
jgi:hypothetical protein